METMWTGSMEDLRKASFNPNDKIYFICDKCHKNQCLTYKCLIKRDVFMCRSCRGVETQLKLAKENPQYGWFAHSVKDGTRFRSDEFKEKRKATMLEKYGVEFTTQSEILNAKRQSTNLERYGVVLFTNRAKCIETNLKKHGVKYAGFQDNPSKEKSKQTCLSKYGCEFTAQVPEIRAKQMQTSIEKRGYAYHFESEEFRIDRRNYVVNGISFDSKPEIYYYFWLKDQNIVFEYNQLYPKTYFDAEGKEHSYYYDFKIGDKFIEIKGDHFFTDGKPYTTRLTGQLYDWSAKYDFLLSEGIDIVLSSRIEHGDLVYVKNNFLEHHSEVIIQR